MKCSMTNLLEYGSDCFINLKPEIRTVGVRMAPLKCFVIVSLAISIFLACIR